MNKFTWSTAPLLTLCSLLYLQPYVAIAQVDGQYYIMKPNDQLRFVAKKACGDESKWLSIWKANLDLFKSRDIDSPNKIPAKTRIYIDCGGSGSDTSTRQPPG